MDLRHLAVILDVGAKAARNPDDPALSHTLNQMCEVATALALHPNGGGPLDLTGMFDELRNRYE